MPHIHDKAVTTGPLRTSTPDTVSPQSTAAPANNAVGQNRRGAAAAALAASRFELVGKALRVPEALTRRQAEQVATVGANLVRAQVPDGLNALLSRWLTQPPAGDGPWRLLQPMSQKQDWPFNGCLALLAWLHKPTRKRMVRKEILTAISGVELAPYGVGNDRRGVGDLQNRSVGYLREHAPDLLANIVSKLPELHGAYLGLDASTRRLGAKYGRPLAGFNAVVIGHVLAEAPTFMQSLQRLGLDPNTTTVLGVPYSSNELAIEALSLEGFDVANPHGSGLGPKLAWGTTQNVNTAYRHDAGPEIESLKRSSVQRALQRAINRHEGNGKPILIIDDGGFAAQVAAEKFPDQLSLFRFVEQTTRGIRQVKASGLKRLTVNVAGSRVKREIEGPFVAAAVSDALRIELGSSVVKGKHVAVLGYGAIGSAAARVLRKMGAKVTVHDPDPSAAAAAKTDGFEIQSQLRAALQASDLVMGTSGHTSIGPDDFAYIKPGALLVSTSSVDIEFKQSWAVAEAVDEIESLAADALSVSPTGLEIPAPKNLDLTVRYNNPGGRYDHKRASRSDLYRNRIGHAFASSLESSMRRMPGVNVAVKASIGFDEPPGLSRVRDMMTGGTRRSATHREVVATVSSTTQSAPLGVNAQLWEREIREASLGLREGRDPVWLLNGGYPINLSRRLVSMPADRIQITLAALVAGAVQAATACDDQLDAGIVDLDHETQEALEQDFAAQAPDAYAYARQS